MGDYLSVYRVAADCAIDADDTPFAPGPFGDLPVRDTGFGWEALIGDTVVQFDTTLSDVVLGPVVVSMTEADLDAVIADLNQRMESSGYWE